MSCVKANGQLASGCPTQFGQMFDVVLVAIVVGLLMLALFFWNQSRINRREALKQKYLLRKAVSKLKEKGVETFVDSKIESQGLYGRNSSIRPIKVEHVDT